MGDKKDPIIEQLHQRAKRDAAMARSHADAAGRYAESAERIADAVAGTSCMAFAESAADEAAAGRSHASIDNLHAWDASSRAAARMAEAALELIGRLRHGDEWTPGDGPKLGKRDIGAAAMLAITAGPTRWQVWVNGERVEPDYIGDIGGAVASNAGPGVKDIAITHALIDDDAVRPYVRRAVLAHTKRKARESSR